MTIIKGVNVLNEVANPAAWYWVLAGIVTIVAVFGIGAFFEGTKQGIVSIIVLLACYCGACYIPTQVDFVNKSEKVYRVTLNSEVNMDEFEETYIVKNYCDGVYHISER